MPQLSGHASAIPNAAQNATAICRMSNYDPYISLAMAALNDNMNMIGSFIKSLMLNPENQAYDFIADELLSSLTGNQIGQFLANVANDVREGGECARLAKEMVGNVLLDDAIHKIKERVNDIFNGITKHCPCLASKHEGKMNELREHWEDNMNAISSAVSQSRARYKKKCSQK